MPGAMLIRRSLDRPELRYAVADISHVKGSYGAVLRAGVAAALGSQSEFCTARVNVRHTPFIIHVFA